MQEIVQVREDGHARATQPARRVRYHLVILALSSLLLAASFALSFEGSSSAVALPGGVELPTLCWSRGLFGVECPGCGLTRSFVAIAHGEFARAWRTNPAGFVWFAAVALQIPLRLYLLRRAARKQDAKDIEPAWLPTLTAVSWTMLIGATMLQWAVRMLL
jgi:hypothetical protein